MSGSFGSTRYPTTSTSGQAGVGLIEVLIAILVLSVGVLGFVSLQLNAKVTNYEAVQRSTAANLAHNLLERIRTNPSQAASYVATLGGDTLGASPATDCATTTAVCTAAQMASFDLWEFEEHLDGNASNGGLINPTACITNNNNYVTVAIAWQGKIPLDQTGVTDCGDGKYDAPGESAGTDGLRQILEISTFVYDPS